MPDDVRLYDLDGADAAAETSERDRMALGIAELNRAVAQALVCLRIGDIANAQKWLELVEPVDPERAEYERLKKKFEKPAASVGGPSIAELQAKHVRQVKS